LIHDHSCHQGTGSGSRAATLRFDFAFAAAVAAFAFAVGFGATGSLIKGGGADSVATEAEGRDSDIAIMSAMV
jgi:hypothetical protein